MSKRKGLFLVLFAVIAVAGLVFLHSERFGAVIGCTPSVREQVASPNNQTVAVVFEMECGATVGFNTQLAALPRNEKNANSLAQSAFLVLSERRQLDLRWISENVLAVRVPKDTKIFRQEQPKAVIQVVYE